MQPILKIDLTTNKTEEYQIPEKWEKDFWAALPSPLGFCIHP